MSKLLTVVIYIIKILYNCAVYTKTFNVYYLYKSIGFGHCEGQFKMKVNKAFQ